MENKKNNSNNAKKSKNNAQVIAIIALLCGVVILFGAAIGIALSDSTNTPKQPSNSSSQIEDEWTKPY